MRALRLLAAVAFVFTSTGTALAQAASEPVVFSSTRFVRTQGRPHTVDRTFIVPSWVVGPFTLRVQNGEPDGSDRLVLGWVWINGTRVVAPSDFRRNRNRRLDEDHDRRSFSDRDDDDEDEQADRRRDRRPSDGLIVREVTLQAVNTVRVRLAGRRGRHITLSITGTNGDRTAPELTLLEPTVAVVNTQAVAVRWRYGDSVGPGERGASGVVPSSFRLTVDGVDRTSTIAASAGEASGMLDVGEGAHAIEARVSDLAGNAATASSTFVLDTSPPRLTIIEPLSGTATTSSEVTVTGTVEDLTLQSIVVNGMAASVVGAGSDVGAGFSRPFHATVPLLEGDNVIVVTATDATGLSSEAQVHVTRIIETPCDYSVSPSSAALSADGASGVLSVFTVAGCTWTASTTTEWIEVTSIAEGYGAQVIGDGAAGFWRLGESESDGGIVRDSSGHGLDGALSGSFTQGVAGALAAGNDATLFEGASVQFASAPMLLGGPLTVEAWLRDPWWGTIASGSGWWLTIESGRVRFRAERNEVEWFNVRSDRSMDEGDWHHVVAVYDPGQRTANVFVDGQLDATGPTLPSTLGRSLFFTIGPMAATLDDMAVYRSALSASQVAAHFEQRTSLGGGSGTVGYTIEANPSFEPRVGSVIVAGLAVSIAQAGRQCFSGVPAIINPGPGAASGTIHITAIESTCAWTASSTAPWVSFNPSSGIGSGDVHYVVAANPSPLDRGAAVMIAGQGVPVNQAGVAASRPGFHFSVAAGLEHSLALKNDGSVWSWGANGSRQLGDGTTVFRGLPVPVPAPASVVAIAAGDMHSLALKTDGTVWAWGANGWGQLGNGTFASPSTPVQTSGLTNVVAIAAGSDHNVALKADGTVWTWGRNLFGQIGDGTTSHRPVPTLVTGLPSRAISVAASGTHTVVVDAVGRLWEFGNGTLTPSQVALAVPVITAVASRLGWFALASDDTVWAFGINDRGQVGDGTTTPPAAPVQLTTIGPVSQMSAGLWHTLTLGTNGTVWAWGGNDYRQLGDGTPLCSVGTPGCPSLQYRPTPAAVDGPAGVVAVSANGNASSSLAVGDDGRVWTWGNNDARQLGDGTIVLSPSPLQIADAGFAWHTGTPILTSGGVFNFERSATAVSATSGAVIHYTLNGADPTEADPIMPAAPAGIAIEQSTTLKARAWAAGKPPSGVALETYTLKPLTPAVSPGGGIYTAAQLVSLTTTTAATTIRYSLDGTDPTATSPAYVSPISIATPAVLKAAAFRSGWARSDVVSAEFSFETSPPPPPPPPVIPPPAAGPCTYHLTPGAVAAPAQATTGELAVTTSDESCGWSVESDVPWLSLEPTGNTSAYAQVVVVDDPVGYWRLTDPVGAAVASDLSGFGRLATVSGGVTFGSAGPLADRSTAARFDGLTGAIEIAHDVGLRLSALTWEAWVNVPAVSGEWRWVLGEGGSDEVFSLWIAPGSRRATLYYNLAAGGRRAVLLEPTLVGAGWVHLAFTFGATTWHAYVNGIEDQTGPTEGALASSDGPIVFGRDQAGDSWYDGLLAEAALYPYALSRDQVASHAAQRGVMVRGAGRFTYVVAANLTAMSRTTTMTVAGAAVPVMQAAVGGIAIAGGASTLSSSGWTNANVTVSFVCAGEGPVACPPPVTLSREGEHDVPGQATNEHGVTASTSVHVRVDRTPPYVSVSSPSLGQLVAAGGLAVRGTTIDLLSGLTGVTCNDQPATITDVTFLCNVTIPAGTSTITLRAFDAASNLRSTVVSIGTEDAVSSSPPTSLRVTPQNITMLAGQTRRFSLLDDFDRIPSQAEWTIDNATVATLRAAPDAQLTAVSAGEVTVTARWQGLTASTRVTVMGSAAAAVGTTIWSAPPVRGAVERIVQGAVTLDNERRLYALEHDEANAQDLIRAFDVDGREVWATPVLGRVIQLSGDPFGGVVALHGSTITGFTPGGSGFAVGLDSGPGFAIDADGAVYYVKEGVVMAGGGSLLLPGPETPGGSIDPGIPTVLEDGRVAVPIHVTNAGLTPNRVQLVVMARDGATAVHTVWESPAAVLLQDGTWSRPPGDAVTPYKAVPNGKGDIYVAWSAVHASLGSTTAPVSAYVGVVRGDGQPSAYLAEVGGIWGIPGRYPFGDLVVAEDRVITTAYRLFEQQNEAVASQLTLTGLVISQDAWSAPEGQVPELPTFLAAAGGGFIASYPDGTMGGLDPVFDQMHLSKAQYQGDGAWVGAANRGPAVVMGPAVAEANSVWSAGQGGHQWANVAKKPGQGILLKGHTLFRGINHASIRVVPRHTEKWLRDLPKDERGVHPLSNRDDFGNLFFTIGAGPDAAHDTLTTECFFSPFQVVATLTSGINRDGDVFQPPADLGPTFYSPILEDKFIANLIARNKAYENNLNYICIPRSDNQGYNSNSYALGLLKAAGMGPPPFMYQESELTCAPINPFGCDRYPGWQKPVPEGSFK